MDWYSPSRIKAADECALMAAEDAKDLGAIGAMGTLRHRAIELYLTGKAASMADSADRAGDEARRDGVLDEDQIAEAKHQVRRLPLHVLPNRDDILSVEGSNLPTEWTQRDHGRSMLAIPIKSDKGPWGAPFGLRMIIDVLTVRDDVAEIIDWKGAQPGSESDHDIQATINFIGAMYLLRRWKLHVTKVIWRAVAVPSGLSTTIEFNPEQFDTDMGYHDWLFVEVARVRGLLSRQEPTPGRHCDACRLFGTPECAATNALAIQSQVDVEMETRRDMAGVAAWSDRDLAETFERAKAFASFIEAVREKTREEIVRRVRAGAIVPAGEGMAYAVRQKGGKITWDFDRLVDLVCQRFGVSRDDLRIPKALAPLIGVACSKAEAEAHLCADLIRGQKGPMKDRLRECFTQNETLTLVTVPHAEAFAEREIEGQGVLPLSTKENGDADPRD